VRCRTSCRRSIAYGTAITACVHRRHGAQLQEVAAIADNPQPPSFDNTIVALERSGRLLSV
jgi:Zn-dependent oligopeptidase